MPGKQTVTVDGLTFSTEGATAPEGYTLWLDDITGWGSGGGPGVRRDRTPRLWGHGEFTDRGWRDARLVTLEGDATSPTVEIAALAEQSLNALLADGLLGKLTVADTATVEMWAMAELFSEPKVGWKNDTTATYQVQFLCPDPRRYGTSVVGSTGVPVPGGGMVHDLFASSNPGIIDFGEAGDPGTVTLTNAGKADTPAQTFRVTGIAPDSGFTIKHLQSESVLQYSTSLASGDELVIDCADGSVMLNGYADRSTYLTRREWVRLGPGQTGTWLLESPGSSNLRMEVEVAPAWW